MSFYSQRHYQRVSPRSDTPTETESRKARAALWRQVATETEARFPVVTPANAREALAFQAQRARELGASL